MNRNILIFGGTTEGRMLASFLEERRIPYYISVATEYGGELLGGLRAGVLLEGRMDEDEIGNFTKTHDIRCIVDATHPYAVEISRNIRRICGRQDLLMIRIKRGEDLPVDGAVYVRDAQEAAAYLEQTKGNILLTTGSKDLPVYASGISDPDRIYARILPASESLDIAGKAGIPEDHLIQGLGPFGEEQNLEALRMAQAAWMVTKDSGAAGGFPEKIAAAEKYGTKILILRRPGEAGMTVSEACCRILTEIKEQ